jgi:CHAT domain-containing protein
LPTVSSLKELRNFAGHSSAPRPFLGIGDPAVEGSSASLVAAFHGPRAGSLADAARALEPIPETASELKAIADALGAGDGDLVLRDQARKPRIASLPLDQYRLLAFATHGLRKGELPGLSEAALILTPPPRGAASSEEDDGLLKASDVVRLKLDADWVVLSACNTAAASGWPGAGGLSGLARAFLYAGARSLLVSHWSVPSDAAVRLTTMAFRSYAQEPDLGRAEALRRSMVSIMATGMPDRFAHPQSWAPFVIVGDGGAKRQNLTGNSARRR